MSKTLNTHPSEHVLCLRDLSTGTTLNFFLDDRINRAEVLFPGVGAFLIAAIIGSWLHASNVADIDRKLGIQRSGGIIDK